LKVNHDNKFSLPVSSIVREAVRCKNLVQNLLIYARKGEEAASEFEINPVIESALSLVRTHPRIHSVELNVDLHADGQIKANKTQIQHIIINLCSNAIDAVPNGGRVTVQTKTISKNGASFVEIQVQDNGRGIPEAIRKNIFDPFFTTKEVGKGTGLGLSLVYEIVKKHNGIIEVESEMGKGTTFVVTLPLTSEPARPIGRSEV